MRIRYRDEDGDFISMNGDEDVQMAFDAGVEEGGGTVGGVVLYVCGEGCKTEQAGDARVYMLRGGGRDGNGRAC